MITRRKTLKMMGVGAAGLAGSLTIPWFARAQPPQNFDNELKIPELLTGDNTDAGKLVSLKLQRGVTEFFPGISTDTLGVNGSYLGPTLRLRNDELVRLRVHNTLGEPSAIHWHGLHVPARSDGGPNQIFQHNQTWDPLIQVMQTAGTYWYHSHMLHRTAEQVYRGLAGMIIVDDEVSDRLDIPSRYGIDDIPLILQDRRFAEDGSFRYMGTYGDIIKGMRGDTILVNGTSSPYLNATTSKLRLRLLNAANARTFTLAFSDDRRFVQIASDGGFLERPIDMNSVVLSPGERAEIIVDLSDGAPVTLVNVPQTPTYPRYPGAMSELMREMNIEAFDMLAIRPQSAREASAEVPAEMTRIHRLTANDAVKTRRFRLAMGYGPRSGEDMGPGTGYRNGYGGGHGGGNFSINGRKMVSQFINEEVRLGDTEIWEVVNESPMIHPFHIHSTQFQVLDRNGEPPPPNEMGLKDTVKVRSGETVRILISFRDFSDAENTYMYHCHNLEHEDRGMMGQFLVI
ncbi:MAG: multicopper oxidase domain-containing protein [Pseudohongiellaceae bacterium]